MSGPTITLTHHENIGSGIDPQVPVPTPDFTKMPGFPQEFRLAEEKSELPWPGPQVNSLSAVGGRSAVQQFTLGEIRSQAEIS